MTGVWIKTRKIPLKTNIRHYLMFPFARNISIRKDNLEKNYKGTMIS